MSQQMIAALIAIGVVSIVLLAVLGLMRPKQITLVDYPELPAPPKDDPSGGPDHASLRARSALEQRSASRVQPEDIREPVMRTFATTFLAICGICGLAACESAGSQYDGVSRFAGRLDPIMVPEVRRERRLSLIGQPLRGKPSKAQANLR